VHRPVSEGAVNLGAGCFYFSRHFYFLLLIFTFFMVERKKIDIL
jgi:hypothetical protein